jgi:hypothetical protein
LVWAGEFVSGAVFIFLMAVYQTNVEKLWRVGEGSANNNFRRQKRGDFKGGSILTCSWLNAVLP